MGFEPPRYFIISSPKMPEVTISKDLVICAFFWSIHQTCLEIKANRFAWKNTCSWCIDKHMHAKGLQNDLLKFIFLFFRGECECNPRLPQIMQSSHPHLRKLQRSAHPECNGWVLPWENHLVISVSPLPGKY